MNDAGADEAIKDLAESHAREPDLNRFLSPTYNHNNKRSSRPNSETSSVSSVPTQSSQKDNVGIGPSRPHRTSCFWERFSHDSREDEEEEVENVRRSRNEDAGLETRGPDTRNGSTNSSSPMREAEGGLVGPNVGGDEEENIRELQEMERKGEEDEQLPGMYFFLSTAFPLISATLGPIANVTSICALAVPWRVYIPPNSSSPPDNSYKISDPAWSLALNAVSLACGFAANIILLLNLSRRIRSAHLQPITITLWYLASFLLIALLSCYRQYLYSVPRENHTWSQAFYYGIIAASLYFLIATLLVGNYIGVLTGKYARQFTLTIAQRTLMLQTMSLMGWLCLGAGVFAKLEGWAYLDGIYFCDTTFLVIGLGDYTLTTKAGRALLFPYATIGIVTVGLIVSSIRGLVLERGKRKVRRRLLEKQREVIVDGGEHGAVDRAESQKERFELMRKVQDRADRKRKWMSLCTSVTFFLVFWLGGAFVFMKAEKDQKWTYFQSLYFCYTTILTIGYGDFTPTSNSAKPFFVIWTLLAVPMMTILVSNLGDTIIVIIKNVTLWLGEWTILPEEKLPDLGGRNRWLKTETQRRRQRRIQGSEKFQQAQREREEQRRQELRDDDEEDIEEKRALERIGTGLINREGMDRDTGSGEERNKRLFHDLAFSIQKLMPDLASKSPKQYGYEEWSSYLKLINMQDPRSKIQPAPKAGEAGVERHPKDDWLGENSPLMSRQSETEWLLTRLCSRLEECLREERDKEKKRRKGKARSEGLDIGGDSAEIFKST
ncbi:Potassium channel [Orbilia oligospora]|uniref:Potassium channel n=1 Tax=Orbilia oligospora TaxID=2813651 RepID=A0A7C8PX08_ORBOL|nr:Potassium channel [Orbilia oligospora]TGJ69252.1 Potassium channel [Orbilia oligospora]